MRIQILQIQWDIVKEVVPHYNFKKITISIRLEHLAHRFLIQFHVIHGISLKDIVIVMILYVLLIQGLKRKRISIFSVPIHIHITIQLCIMEAQQDQKQTVAYHQNQYNQVMHLEDIIEQFHIADISTLHTIRLRSNNLKNNLIRKSDKPDQN